MKIENFKLADLVSFGNYLLSEKREQMINEKHKDQEPLRGVTHADISNWFESEKKEIVE